MWIEDPEAWHAHLLAVAYGFVAVLIVGLVLAAMFWIKGKWFA